MGRLKVFFYLFLLTLLFLLGGYIFWGEAGFYYALIFATIFNLSSYWFSDKVILTIYGAKEVSPTEAPELYALVKKLAENAGLPMPKVAVMPQDQPNAFATGRSPRYAVVAVTKGLLHTLSSRELEGVLAHELAHIKNYDMLLGTIAAVLASALAFLPRIFIFTDSRDRNAGIGLISFILFPIAALLIRLAMSRAAEYRADTVGAQICRNPLALAEALQSLSRISQRVPLRGVESTSHLFIVNPFRGGSITHLLSTHPPIEKRIEKLKSMAKT